MWRSQIHRPGQVLQAASDGERAVLWIQAGDEQQVLARGRVRAMTELADATGDDRWVQVLRQWLRDLLR